jgi:hypothetical protein
MSAYTPTYPYTLSRLFAYRKESLELTNPKIEQANAYSFFEQCIGAAYGELERLCNQPILQRSWNYQFNPVDNYDARTDLYLSRKYILPIRTVPVTSVTMQSRMDIYNSFTTVDTTLYKVESAIHGWQLYYRTIGESFAINALVGYTESALPEEVYMAAVELTQGAILRSPNYGDGRLGKTSQQASGTGAGYSTSYADISKEVRARLGRYIAGVA